MGPTGIVTEELVDEPPELLVEELLDWVRVVLELVWKTGSDWVVVVVVEVPFAVVWPVDRELVLVWVWVPVWASAAVLDSKAQAAKVRLRIRILPLGLPIVFYRLALDRD